MSGVLFYCSCVGVDVLLCFFVVVVELVLFACVRCVGTFPFCRLRLIRLCVVVVLPLFGC